MLTHFQKKKPSRDETCLINWFIYFVFQGPRKKWKADYDRSEETLGKMEGMLEPRGEQEISLSRALYGFD